MSQLVVAQRAEGRAAAGAARSASNGRSTCCAAQPFYAGSAGCRRRRATPSNSRSTTARPRRDAYRERLPRLAEVVKAIAIAELESDGALRRGRARRVLRALRRERAHGRRPRALPRLPRLHPAGAQRRAGERGPDGDAVRRAAGQGAGAADRPARGGLDRHRSLRVRRAQRAPRHHGDGPGRHVRPAGDRSSNLYAMRERVGRGVRAPRAGAVQRLRGLAGGGRRPAAVPDRGGGDGVARVSGVHATTPPPATTGRRASRSRTTASPTPTGRVEPFEYADEAMQRVSEDVAVHARRLRALRPPLRGALRASCRASAGTTAMLPGRRMAGAARASSRRAHSVRAGRRCRRRAAPRHRRRAADAGDAALPARSGIGCRSTAASTIRTPSGCSRARTRRVGQSSGRRRRKRSRPRPPRGAAPRWRSGCRGTPRAGGRAAPTAEPRAGAPSADEAWIETARCPSCNECQNINDKMFTYNENKQAYIKDINAGTYRQLVEAAEVCQVAIIHPGKPWNPNEPGLDELIARGAVPLARARRRMPLAGADRTAQSQAASPVVDIRIAGRAERTAVTQQGLRVVADRLLERIALEVEKLGPVKALRSEQPAGPGVRHDRVIHLPVLVAHRRWL